MLHLSNNTFRTHCSTNPLESLREYYARTSQLWETEAHSLYKVLGKELRKQAFELAKVSYEEWQPKLEETRLLQKLNEIEVSESVHRPEDRAFEMRSMRSRR
jgi:hypothetical protein